MKKVFFTAALALAFAFGMSSCNNNAEAPVDSVDSADAPVECVDTACNHQCNHECTCADTNCKAANCENCPNKGTDQCCKAKNGEKACCNDKEGCKHECKHECQHECQHNK